MKKLLLIVVTITSCDLQAMWLEAKIRKILPKRSYILSAIVRNPTNEEKKPSDVNRRMSTGSRPISVATSDTATNNVEFTLSLSDIKQSSSEITITSSVEDNSNSIASDYVSMATSKIFFEEEVFPSIEAARSLPNFNPSFNSTTPFYEDEGVLDMEMSDAEQSSHAEKTSPGYTMSEEYFPAFYREKQTLDIQKHQYETSYNPAKRRKSSMDTYYQRYK